MNMASSCDEITFEEVWKNSDQILLVEGKELHVHRCLLSLWSPVFDRMFNSDFVEKKSQSVTLHGKNYEEMKEMLLILYDRRREITDANFDYLLELADEYQMDQLRAQCVKHIENANKSGLNAIKYFGLTRRFQIQGLEEVLLKEVHNIDNNSLTASEEYQKLDECTKLDIITERCTYQENLIQDFKQTVNTLIEYLYNRAHDGYVTFLHEQGLQESIFTKCDQQETHQNKRMGQMFDFKCSRCRKRVRTAKQFNIHTNDIIERLDTLYQLQEKA